GRSVFAKGMLLTILVFAMMRELEPNQTYPFFGVVLNWERNAIQFQQSSKAYSLEWQHARSNQAQIASLNTNLVVGFGGGLLARWRFRANSKPDDYPAEGT